MLALAAVATSTSLVVNPRCALHPCPVCRAEAPQLRHPRLLSCAPENKQEGDQESTVPASSPQMPFVWPSEKVSSAGAGGGGGDIPPVDPRPEQPGGDPGPGTLILLWRDVRDIFEGRAYLTPNCNPDPYPYPYPYRYPYP